MNDREIFRKNLNYYLSVSGKLQKDLADYVGAKTTTVSGWTRGVSYPRADAMEKIALFFGIPTSRLVGQIHDDSNTSIPEPSAPQTLEALPPCSDNNKIGVPTVSHPNTRVTIYQIAI